MITSIEPNEVIALKLGRDVDCFIPLNEMSIDKLIEKSLKGETVVYRGLTCYVLDVFWDFQLNEPDRLMATLRLADNKYVRNRTYNMCGIRYE